MTINEKILLLRESHGLTQQEFGDKLGVLANVVSEWESSIEKLEIRQIQSISNFFAISLDYLVNDITTTKRDKEALFLIEKYNEKKLKMEEKNNLVRKCIDYLDKQNVVFDESILPYIENDGMKINLGCFALDKEGNIELSYDKLVENGQAQIVLKLFAEKVLPADAIALDDKNLMEYALKNYRNIEFEHKKLSENQNGTEELESTLKRNNLSVLLENLDPKLINYYYFIVTLIENGARYYKQVGHGYDDIILNDVDDFSKTSFIYRLASDMLK